MQIIDIDICLKGARRELENNFIYKNYQAVSESYSIDSVMNQTVGKPFATTNFLRRRVDPIYQKTPEKKNQSDDSFHVSVSPVATFVQFLALMPVCGISQLDPNDLEFKWKSFRTVFTLMYITYGVFISVTFFVHIIGEGISAKNIGKLSDHELSLRYM